MNAGELAKTLKALELSGEDDCKMMAGAPGPAFHYCSGGFSDGIAVGRLESVDGQRLHPRILGRYLFPNAQPIVVAGLSHELLLGAKFILQMSTAVRHKRITPPGPAPCGSMSSTREK